MSTWSQLVCLWLSASTHARIALRRDEGTGSALFHDVSFDVNEGEFVVIKGRSGSGCV